VWKAPLNFNKPTFFYSGTLNTVVVEHNHLCTGIITRAVRNILFGWNGRPNNVIVFGRVVVSKVD